MKINRLIAIVVMLLNRKKISAAELAEKFEASVPFMVQKGMKENEARALMENCLPNLKRWRKSKITCKVSH